MRSKASLRKAFNQMQTYRHQIPDVFTWNQVTVISDGMQARAATFTAPWEHYAPWRTIDGTSTAPDSVPAVRGPGRRDAAPRGVAGPWCATSWCSPTSRVGLVKKVAKYHQYWAVTKAVEATLEAVAGDGRAGVVWHTQGSGKSLGDAVLRAAKVMRHPAMENPTLVVLTDRNDLDDQLFDDTFAVVASGCPAAGSPGAGGVPRPPEGRC